MRFWSLPAAATEVDELELREGDAPSPGSGEVRLRVRALSINARDKMIVAGPFGRIDGHDLIPLSDVAGEIDAVGPEVEEWSVGDRVTNLHFLGWEDGPQPAGLGLGLGALEEEGVLAEQVVLPAARVTRAPSHLDFAEAATLPVAGVTAWNAMFASHPVSGDDAVATVGSGGVSLFALQMAVALGADVYAGVRQDDKGERLVDLGARSFINTEDDDWGEAIAKRSDGGVQTFVDTVGASVLDEALSSLAPGGEVAVLGMYEMEPAPLDISKMLEGQRSLRGVSVGSNRMHRDLVAFLEEHDIHPVIDRRFSFEQAQDAFRAQGDHETFGKIVIELG